jgi:hypothetical protein
MHGREAERNLREDGQDQNASDDLQAPVSGADRHRDAEAEQGHPGDHRAQPMSEVDCDPCGIGEHPALVVDTETAPEHERVLEVHGRPERALTGGKIRTGHRRVIGARPAAEEDLQREQGETRRREGAQRRLRPGERPPLRRERQPAQNGQRGETSQKVRRHDQRLQQQGHRLHPEEPLQTHHDEKYCRRRHGLIRIAAIDERQHE